MQFIDLHRQYERIEEKINHGFQEVLAHKRFIMGDEVISLEKRLSEYVGVKHVICCASGTDALVIPLLAYDLKKEDAIFVPSFTFFASAESVSIAGGTPVFVDCDETYNMSIESLSQAIEKVKKEGKLSPKGVIAVDLFGLPANHTDIQKIADRNNLFVIEDGAQGFGGKIGEHKACSFGDVAATSFFPAKPLGCYGDGGAIFTNNDDLANQIKSIHIHGQGVDKYDNIQIGINSRLDTLQAVVLDAKLDIFDEELVLRNKVAEYYKEELKSDIAVPVVPNGFYSSWAQFTLKSVDEKGKNKILSALTENSIPSAIYYPTPAHMSTAYSSLRQNQIALPQTESVCKRVFSIPMHPYLKETEIEQICEVIKKAVK